MKCPKCNHENREEAKFCEECGQKLSLICPKCGSELREKLDSVMNVELKLHLLNCLFPDWRICIPNSKA